jgi:hypothetical protein
MSRVALPVRLPGWFAPGFVALLMTLAPAGGALAQDTSPAGWTVSRVDQANCVATGPSGGGASLSLAAEGPLFMLLVAAPDFPKPKATYAAELAFDGKAPVSSVALGDGGVMGIRLGRGDAAKTLTAAGRVSISVDGHAHLFSLQGAREALDAVARCAGEPTLSEQVEKPAQPIAGAGRWTLMASMPGVSGPACSARVPGDQIDTIMLLNRDGQLVLVGGHPDWATWGETVPLALSVDGAAPVHLTADAVNNLIVILVKDPDLLQRLRTARSLTWTIPTGEVRGDVTGLGAALDAIAACAKRAPQP